MDPFRLTTIAHTTHEMCNPIDSPAFDRFIESMHVERGLRVLDAGCGKGEALIRVAGKRDAYDGPYAGNVERFFAEHPGDPDRDEFLNRIRSWHALYRKWGRDTMGFAMYRARKL